MKDTLTISRDKETVKWFMKDTLTISLDKETVKW